MTLRKFTIVPMLALSLFAVGCGADCESLCEDAKDEGCEGFDDVDCAKNCEDVEALNEKAGCEDTYDELISCASDADDICKAGEGCDSEAGKHNECITEYCTDHLEECADLAG